MMQKLLFLLFTFVSLQAKAQLKKLSVNMAATYNVPVNKYLQYGVGTTVGLQYELNKKLNIFANYTNFKNQFLNSTSKCDKLMFFQ